MTRPSQADRHQTLLKLVCPGFRRAHHVCNTVLFEALAGSACDTRSIEQGLAVFEFVCDRIIPGCRFVERDDTEEKLLEQAMDHLRERHNMDYIDKPLEGRLLSIGILPVQ